MGEFDQLLSLNLGGASFQLDDYGYASEPIVKDGRGRAGTRLRLTCTGWVSVGAEETTADYGAAVVAAVRSFSVSGQNVEVKEFNGALLVQILAAWCVDGGPHVTFSLLPNKDGVGLVKRFSVTVNASTWLDGGGVNPTTEPSNAYTIRTTTGPDGLRRVEIVGELLGVDAGGYYRAQVVPTFRRAYPAASWGLSERLEANTAGDKTSYTITFAELVEPYPGAAPDLAVDGEHVDRKERDEQMRLVTRYSYDLLVVGSPQLLLNTIRPKGVTILRESSEVTHHLGKRLRAEFVVLAGGNGNDLLNFEQSFNEVRSADVVEVARYAGLKPFLVRTPADVFRYQQRGRAVGLNRFPKPPDPLTLPMTAPPQIQHTQLNGVECETTWQYDYATVDQYAVRLADLARPATPQFE
jgi:hypothetical protein